MALIKCSECGKQMSDQAATCPHCGMSNKAYTYCNFCGAKCVSDNFCTNCGRSMNGLDNQTPKKNTNSMALAGGVTGICSLFIDLLCITSTTAIVLSSIGLSQVKSNNQKGKGWAITGLVCGIIEFVWMSARLIIYFSK